MPICAKCDQRFPSRIVIDGKERNLSSRKYCLSCSPFGQHNTRIPGDVRKKRGNAEGVKRWRKRMMEKAIEYKGGECQLCGYKRCTRALEFHHLNPKEKSFSLSVNGFCRSWDRIKDELDKCVLLCANCHREVEDNLVYING